MQQHTVNASLFASFTIQPLREYLADSLLQNGFNNVIHLAPYNRVIESCLSRDVLAETNLVMIIWRIEDLFLNEIDRALNGESFQDLKSKFEILKDAVNFLETKKYSVIFFLPPFPHIPHLAFSDINTRRLLEKFYAQVKNYYLDWLKQRPDLYIFDLDFLERSFGSMHVNDLRTWYLFRQPWADKFCRYVGDEVAKFIKMMVKPAKKCIVLDCDGVLWGGIIGEDGMHNIVLSNDFPGIVYKDVQRYLLEQKKQGLLLAILSKNNQQDVWEVFEKHDEMILKKEHISAFSINWDPKYKGITAIAQKLNISTDSIIFVDDNQFEIEEVRKFCPEVLCLLASRDLLQYLNDIKKLPTHKLNLTNEDHTRVAMINDEHKRQQQRDHLSYDEFIKSLQINVEVQFAKMQHIDRVEQLVNKTNQFNLTTRRYTKTEILSRFNDVNYKLFVASVKDNFGDYGLTGVAICKIDENSVLFFESFLLSCRVLTRGVEGIFLAEIFNFARQFGCKICKAKFIPTSKNAPADNFLPSHNFIKNVDGFWYAKL